MIDMMLSGSGSSRCLGSRCRFFFLSWQRWLFANCLVCSILPACNPAPATHEAAGVPPGVVAVRIRKTTHGYQLLRGGKPYFIKGAAGLQHFGQLKQAGGNSVRIWSTDYATPILEEAQRQGITIMLGIWLEPETKYFTYYNPVQVQEQLRRVRSQVLRYRRCPALLCWNIANEMEVSSNNPRLYAALNEVALLIHELDPYHPVTVSQVDFQHNISKLQRLAPAVNVISINTYGALSDLPARLKATTWRGPYIVSEYGGYGYWESGSTAWNAPYEQTSAGKAELVHQNYNKTIIGDSLNCLGGYIFYWGYKFECTPTWFSLFEPTGEKTELVDELQQLWRRQYPANRAPHLSRLLLAGQAASSNIYLVPGQQYPAVVTVIDPEGDSLTCRWEVLPEIVLRFNSTEIITSPEPVPGCVTQGQGNHAVLRTPTRAGAYRLFVRVFDGHGSVATANIPFMVQMGAAQLAGSPAAASEVVHAAK